VKSIWVIVVGLVTAAVFFATSDPIGAEAFGGLVGWINKYPSDLRNSKDFFQAPEIASALTELLPRKEYELLTHSYAVETPIEAAGEYLLVSKCKPHCCPCENVLLAVGLRDDSLVALFWNQNDRTTRCFSTGPRIADLPEAVKEKFLGMHIIKATKDEQLLPKNLWLNKVQCEKRKGR
jgi:hypothetical protein